MVIVKLQGGLGNQMFQYAAGKGLSHCSPVYIDHRFLDENQIDKQHFTARKYELQLFKNIKAVKATAKQLAIFNNNSFYHRLYRRFFKTVISRQIENEYIDFEKTYGKPVNIYLDGYFQSEKYFRHLRSQLLADFEFPALDTDNDNIRKKIEASSNAVSIHVRRGDYLKSPEVYKIHGVLEVQYYQQALSLLKAKYADLTLFVFSDDIDWAMKNLNLNNYPTCYVSGNQSGNSWKDMALMSYCKHHIIANSSFSWWGAWLSKSNGEVFAPDNWFNASNVKFNIHDFIPANWHIISNE